MAAQVPSQREKQEQSIKARKHELFVGEAKAGQGEPRKKFRDVLRETPGTPLSKNVKLILWGSAAPVVFLFVASILTGHSSAKAPEDSVLTPTVVKPPAPQIAKRSDEPPAAPATEAKPEEPKPEATEAKPEKEKPKKGKGKPKPKPKDDSTLAKSDEPAPGEESKEDEPKKSPKSASSTQDNKDKGSMSSSTSGTKKSRFFKEKPKYNPVYPKKTPAGEKKDESKTKPDSGSGSP